MFDLSTFPLIFIIISDSPKSFLSLSLSLSIYIYIYIYHQVTQIEWISLTLSLSLSLSLTIHPYHPFLLGSLIRFILYLHRTVICKSAALACPCTKILNRTSLMSLSLLIQQWLTCLVREVCRICRVCEMWGSWAAVLWGAISRSFSRSYATFLYGSRLASFLCVLFVSM